MIKYMFVRVISSRLYCTVSRLSSCRKRIRIYRFFFESPSTAYSLCLKFLLLRGIATTDTTTRKQFLLPSRGTPISSESPRLITFRTARKGANFFDRSFYGSRSSESLLELLPNNSLRTLYSRNERLASLACL